MSLVGTHDVGRGQRDEQQQRRRHADVLAVGDELEVDRWVVAHDVADAHVDDRRDRHDREQHPREDLLAPRPPDPEGPPNRRSVERQSRLPPATALALVGPISTVVDGAECARGGATHRSPAVRRKTSSSEACRVDKRVQREVQVGDRVAHGIEHLVAVAPVGGDLEAAVLEHCRRQVATSQLGDDALVHAPHVEPNRPGPLEELARRARQHELAGVDHHDVVAHRLHIVEQVRGEHDRDPELVEATHEVEHLLTPHGIESRGGLVEKHELGIGNQRLRELRPLPHAGGEAADRPGTVLRRVRRDRARLTRVVAPPTAGDRSSPRASTRGPPPSDRAAGSRARA